MRSFFNCTKIFTLPSTGKLHIYSLNLLVPSDKGTNMIKQSSAYLMQFNLKKKREETMQCYLGSCTSILEMLIIQLNTLMRLKTVTRWPLCFLTKFTILMKKQNAITIWQLSLIKPISLNKLVRTMRRLKRSRRNIAKKMII